MKQHFQRLAAGAVLASACIATPAHATPATGFTAVQQIKGVYGPIDINTESDRRTDKDDKWGLKLKTKDTTDLWTVRNSIAIGGQSGWHSHPGPSLITVTIGEITVYDSTDPLCSPKVYRAGEGFIDTGDHAHVLRNESGAPAETVATQFLPAGAARRIDEAAPNNCNF